MWVQIRLLTPVGIPIQPGEQLVMQCSHGSQEPMGDCDSLAGLLFSIKGL